MDNDKKVKFPMVDRLGLDFKTVFYGSESEDVVLAEELEAILQSAQVVYGTSERRPDEYEWSGRKLDTDTHQALLINITPIKKKTKAEAALDLLERLGQMDGIFNVAWAKDDINKVLEMKDEV